MIVLSKRYFWKLLETCDPAVLDDTAEAIRSVFSEVIGEEYRLVQPDSSGQEVIRRWSQGCFNGPGEQKLIFPRVLFVYKQSPENNDRWIADIYFTRIPHIQGLYSNRGANHVLPPSMERKLATRLVETHLADVFTRASDNTLVGSTAGAYVYQKIAHMGSLKNLAERSKYTPPASDLRELIQDVYAVLTDGQPSSSLVEIPNQHAEIQTFLSTCDSRVLSTLGKDRLQALLRPAEVSVTKWMNAGHGLLHRLFRR
jgi:hypothetical protein